MSDETDPAGDATADLAIELRKLWSAAERDRGATIKVSAVAKRLHLSPSSVYAYLDGTTLPSLVVLDKLLHELAAPAQVLQHMAELREKASGERRSRRRTARVRGGRNSEQAAIPWQLPPDVRGFTGRSAELARLDELLTAKDDSFAATVALVSGTAGVGKTALVVRWAHRVRATSPTDCCTWTCAGSTPNSRWSRRRPSPPSCGAWVWPATSCPATSPSGPHCSATARPQADPGLPGQRSVRGTGTAADTERP